MLKNFCHESGYKYCDNSNIDGPLYYVNDGIHLNTSKGIPTLVRNMNNCIGNYYQPVHHRKTYRDSVKCLLHFNRAKHLETIDSHMIQFTRQDSTDTRMIMKLAMQTP